MNIPEVLSSIAPLFRELRENQYLLQDTLKLVCIPYERSSEEALQPSNDTTPLESKMRIFESMLDTMLEDMENVIKCIKL
jgi:hypothetical protein